jgi:soluble lytic murein transglycosylase
MSRPSENIPIPRPFCGAKTFAMKFAGRVVRPAGILLCVCLVCCAWTTAAAAHPAGTAFTKKQLEALSRLLTQKNSTWAYSRLRVYAEKKASGVLGIRAALALGVYDYGQGHYARAAKWLERAKADPLLGDYVLYWKAQADIALGQNADALAELERLRKDFPDSVMTEQALQLLGDTALELNRPAEAVDALTRYARTTDKPTLLFLRAQAHEQAGQLLEAAADYQAVYLRFALSDEAGEARSKLAFLRSNLGSKFPPLPLEQRLDHAAILFNAKQWSDARDEYAEILPQLSGADGERAQLRILECGVALGAAPSEMAALTISDADVDAERYRALADYYRGQQQDAQMAAAVESVVSRAPSSGWAESALFLAGNYYWVQLDRDRAASYYARVAKQFPTSMDADAAQWRVAWVAVLKRQPEAPKLLEEHIRRFPRSPFTADALYWLGRLAEEAGVKPLARSYYAKLVERYAQNYFGNLGGRRLGALGRGRKEDPDVLAAIPPVASKPPVSDPPSRAAASRRERADALRSIAFDASAALELRAGYAAAGDPNLLLEAAQASNAAGHYGGGIVMVRQMYPQLESRSFSEVPRRVWLAAYAMPFERSIRRWSARKGLDPMLVTGLIRQESAFEPKARSIANAIGLMQLLPQTARRVARESRVRYSRAKLVNPDYNIRLGTAYFADLRKQFGSVEAALAAYNAGEDRVTAWTAGQNYRETAEFVDSIPFTETREYVQIVVRNAEIYRRLYGAHNAPRKARTRRGR